MSLHPDASEMEEMRRSFSDKPQDFSSLTTLEKELIEALDEIHSWLVCGAIASAEDMAQSFQHMEKVAYKALQQGEVKRSKKPGLDLSGIQPLAPGESLEAFPKLSGLKKLWYNRLFLFLIGASAVAIVAAKTFGWFDIHNGGVLAYSVFIGYVFLGAAALWACIKWSRG